MPNEPHPVYPEGPPCQPNCPGSWSEYHDGYADGYERGEAEARATLLDELVREVAALPSPWKTDRDWCQRSAVFALLDDHKGAGK